MKRISYIGGAAIVLFVLLFAGCSLIIPPDVIVGKWQQVSVGPLPTVVVTVIQFTATTYTGSTAGITSNSGTWTRSGSSYTLTGSFFGLIGTSSTITPTFTNSNNTMTYTDGLSLAEVYTRQ
jgi:hypothetical protein